MKKIAVTMFIGSMLLVGCGQSENDAVDEVETESTDETSKFTIEDDMVTFNGEDITLTFTDEFEVNGDVIKFGPKGFVPEGPTDEEEYIYSLELKDQRDIDEINQEVTVNPELVQLQTTEIQIGGLEGVKWAVGGMCEARIMELFGKEHNIQFYSSGCHNADKETDFKYFENLFK